jgi:hypothetical protein
VTPPKAAPAAPTASTNPSTIVAPPKAASAAKAAPAKKPAAAAKAAASRSKAMAIPDAPKAQAKPIRLTSSRKPKKPVRVITQEEIAVRAYLIMEKRMYFGQHAEPHEDWAEAERQLQAELQAELAS